MLTKSWRREAGRKPVLVLSLGQPVWDGRVQRMAAAWERLGYGARCLTPSWRLSGGLVSGGARRLSGLFRHLRALTGEAPCWIHACDAETLPVAWLLCRVHGSRLLYDAHESFASGDAGWNHRLQARLEAAFLPRADRVMTVNRLIAGQLESRYRRTVFTVPNYLTAGEAAGDAVATREWERQRRNFRPDDVILVYSGALFPGRGLEELPDLALRLPRNWKVLVKGFGPLRQSLRHCPAANRGRLILEEPAPPLRLATELRCADIGLLPYPRSRANNRVSLAGKCFEYAAAGLGIIATPLPAVTALITDEKIGRTVNSLAPAEVIPACVELLRERQEIRRRGEAYTRRHTLEGALEKVISGCRAETA